MLEGQNLADHNGVGSTIGHAVEAGLDATGTATDTADLADVPAVAGIGALGVAHIQTGSGTAPTGEGLKAALAGIALRPDAVGVVGDSHVGGVTIGGAVHGLEAVATVEGSVAKDRADRIVGGPVDDLVAVFLLDVGQEIDQPSALIVTPVPATGTHFAAVRQLLVVTAGEVVHGDAELLQVVGAAHAVGGFAHLLDRGDQETDQHGDDGDDHQQLNQCETHSSKQTHSTTP